MSLDCFGHTCMVPSLRLARRLQKKKLREKRVGQNALQRVLPRRFLRVCCSLFYNAGFQSYQWLLFHLYPVDPETIPGVPGNENVSTGVETDGKLKGRHIVVTRSLVPLAGGPKMMTLRLSTVEVAAGSCWSRRLMMIIIVFKRGIYQYCSMLTSSFYHTSCF